MFKHFLHSAVTQVIVTFLQVILGIIVARALLTEGKGIIAVYLSFLTLIMSLGNLGVRQASSYYLGKLNFTDGEVAVLQKYLLVITTFLVTLVMTLVLYEEGRLFSYATLFLFLAIPFQLYCGQMSGYALARRWVYRMNRLNLVNAATLLTVVAILFYFTTPSVEKYFFGYFLSWVAGSVYVYWWGHRDLDLSFDGGKIAFFRKHVKEFVKLGLAFAVPLFVIGINNQADILILNAFVEKSVVGVYAVSVGVTRLLWYFPQIFNTIVFSHSISSKDADAFSLSLWKKSKRIMLLSLVPFILLALFSVPLILLLYGEPFAEAGRILWILLPGTYAMIWFTLVNGDFAARGYQHITLRVMVVGATVNIGLNLILVPRFGMYGAAIASTGSFLLVSAIYLWQYKALVIKKAIGEEGRETPLTR